MFMKEERTLKENKNYQIKVRLTATEKEAVNNYCEKHGMTVSEFLRAAIENKLFQEERK